MISIVIVSHSEKLASSVVELAKEISKNGIKIVAAGGIDDCENPFGTDVIKIQTAIESVYSDDGVLVLMDLGSAILSAEMAKEFLTPEQQNNVKLCPAPLIEGAISAAVIAATNATIDEVRKEAQQSLTAKLSHFKEDDSPISLESSTQSIEKSLSIILTINNLNGLHIRPAAQFVKKANHFQADIQVKNLSKSRDYIDGKSINQLMLLGVKQGEKIKIQATGNDAPLALKALQELVENNFGESVEEKVEKKSPPFQEELEEIVKKKSPLFQEELEEIVEKKSPPFQGGLGGIKNQQLKGDLGESKNYELKEGLEGIKHHELKGIPASPGIAIAPAIFYQSTLPEIEIKYSQNSQQEWQQLQLALENAKQEIEGLTTTNNLIFQAHLLYLEDPQLQKQIKTLIFTKKYTAGLAWKTVIEEVIASYKKLETEYLQARAIDLLDIGKRVLKILLRTEIIPLKLEKPSIIIAPQLTPSEIAQFNPQKVLGICTAFGSATDHSAIIASLLGIPMVVGIGEKLLEITPHNLLKIDGAKGTIELNISPETVISYPSKPLKPLKQPVTRDGKKISVVANIIGIEDAKLAIQNGAEGIGLLRTEFLYLNRITPPTETEQIEFYQAIAQIIAPYPLTIRTVDIGGDKQIPYLNLEKENNPFLGCRGIRQSLAQPDIFKTQLKAIVKVSDKYNIRLMLPMISCQTEIKQTKKILQEIKQQLQQENICYDEKLPLGIMLEIPASVIMADELADEVDFFSIGTNDLTQYIMAADRTNPKVANLATGIQPALLRLIEQSVKIAHEKRVKISICGQLASTPEAIPILLDLGIDELSVNPPMIPQIIEKICEL